MDEGVRRETTIEALAKLRPAFKLGGIVTAGSSSQMSDGAAFVLVMSEEMVKQLGVKPIARMVTCTSGGVDPLYMGIGPVEAIPKALKQAGLKLSDIDFLLTTQKQIRFNQRQDRLYVDMDWSAVDVGNILVIDCYRLLDPDDSTGVWNDSFLKKYVTAALKKQWGQNLIKFQGVKLPGGIELNGRQIYDDGQKEIDALMEKMSNTYEVPPLDMIG